MKLHPGLYQATIRHILPASFRDYYNRREVLEGYFVQFEVEHHGQRTTLSEVVNTSTHHSSTLARLFGPLLKDRGIPLASFQTVKESFIGQSMGLKVDDAKCGAVFQFLPLSKSKRGGCCAVGGENERQAA